MQINGLYILVELFLVRTSGFNPLILDWDLAENKSLLEGDQGRIEAIQNLQLLSQSYCMLTILRFKFEEVLMIYRDISTRSKERKIYGRGYRLSDWKTYCAHLIKLLFYGLDLPEYCSRQKNPEEIAESTKVSYRLLSIL